ncbi:hypothetical protein [Plantactinospora sp. KBS50]|uniref:hypothetical protein n=1 Tax=Plantactinospora sp. KBS50 TaxID=2024580 RepID=UPI000BAB08D2|nr:hypothetical protein [Plantactinospora sp. KBS50]ASW56029.1 hypothetical protein CIK06_20375 [Plantactinospora sp. KBS50]
MNVNRRDGRETGVQRDTVQRAPRSGGRIVAQRITGVPSAEPVRGSSRRAESIRRTEQTGRTDQAGRVDQVGRTVPAGTARRTGAERPSGPFGADRDGRSGEFRTAGSAALATDPAELAGSAAQPRRTPRLTVAPPPPVLVPRAPFVALILAVVVGGVLGILVVNTKINENAIRLSRMQDQQASLDLRQQQLEDQITQAEAPGNLVAQAKKLGLVDAGQPAFIRLPDGRTIGVPQPTAGGSAGTGQQGTGG